MELYDCYFEWGMDSNDFDFKVQNCVKLRCYDCYIHYGNPYRLIDNKPDAYRFEDLVDLSRYGSKIREFVLALRECTLVKFEPDPNIVKFQADGKLIMNRLKYNVYQLCDVYKSNTYPKYRGTCRIYEFDKKKQPQMTFFEFCSRLILFERYNNEYNGPVKTYYDPSIEYCKNIMSYTLDLDEMNALQDNYDRFSSWAKIESYVSEFDIPKDKNPCNKVKEYHYRFDIQDVFIWRWAGHDWFDVMINGTNKFYYIHCYSD